ncbi:MAG: dihydrofolate reductase family protein [Gaiellales bacterium]
MRASAYVATSLDGYIARPGGELDWLRPDGAGEEDFGFAAFMRSVDVLVMGRNTYDAVVTGAWPYGETPVTVLTSREIDIPLRLAGHVQASSAAPLALADELDERGLCHAYVDGGRTIQSFLAVGLVDEITITRVPIVLGSGIPLFERLNEDVRLRHLGTTSFDNGYVQSRYRVA